MVINKDKPETLEFDYATVVKVLPGTKFEVKLFSNQKRIIAYISGKIRNNKIRILLGDEVKVDSKGRIVYRYTNKKNNNDFVNKGE